MFVSVNLCCQMEGLGGLLGLMLISCFMLIRLARLTGRLRTINDLLGSYWGVIVRGLLDAVCDQILFVLIKKKNIWALVYQYVKLKKYSYTHQLVDNWQSQKFWYHINVGMFMVFRPTQAGKLFIWMFDHLIFFYM